MSVWRAAIVILGKYKSEREFQIEDRWFSSEKNFFSDEGVRFKAQGIGLTTEKQMFFLVPQALRLEPGW